MFLLCFGFFSSPASPLHRTSHISNPSTVSAAPGINRQINFQGKLVNANGTNVTNGSYSIVFSIYTVASAGTAVWTETQTPTVTDGIFQVALGSVTALPGTVDFDTDNIYLGIKVGADAEMTPRIRFGAVPQAFNAEKLGGIDKTGFIQNTTTQQASSNFNISGTGVVGTSLTTPILQNTGANLSIQTATSGDINITPALATGLVNILSGNLKVGNGSPNVTLNGEDFYVEGTLEVDGASRFDGTVALNGVTTANTDVDMVFAGTENLSVTANGVPTADMVSISNSGQAVTTAGVNAFAINYVGGAAAVESSAARIDLQPGGTTGGTWSAWRLVHNTTGPATGVTSQALKIEGPTTGGAGTFNGINIANIGATTTGGTVRGINITGTNSQAAGTIRGIQLNNLTAGAASEIGIDLGTGWDNLLTYNNGATVIINGSGQLNIGNATGQLGIANGGTGASTAQAAINSLTGLTTNGDLLYHNGTNVTRLARGTDTQCLTSNTTTILWGSCGGAATTTLQQAYGNDADGSDAIVALTTSDGSLIFRNPAAGGSASAYLLTLDQLATGAVGGLLVSNAGTGTSLRVDDSSGDTTPFIVDQNGNVGISTATASEKLHVSNSNAATNIRLEVSNIASPPAINNIKSAGTVVNDAAVGSVAWSSPSNATTSNDSYATAGVGVSNYLKSSNHGFALPSDATITGIKAEVEKARSTNNITYDNSSSAATTGTSANSLTWAHTVGTGPDRILIVSVAQSSGNAVTGITYNGVAMTLVSSVGSIVMYRLVNPASGTNNIVVSLSATRVMAATATSWYNVNQGTPLGTPATATSATGSPTVNVTSATGDVVIDAVWGSKATSTPIGSPGAGQTLRATTYDIAAAGPPDIGTSSEAGAASVTMSWSGSPDTWGIIGVALKPATVSSVVDNRVSLVKGGTVQTTNKADTLTNWSTTDTIASYGGSADMWGTTWTPAEINASNFGLAFSANTTGNSPTRVDSIKITVYYTLTSANWTMGVDPTTAMFNIAGSSTIQSATTYLTVSQYGYVGIGNMNPAYNLDVAGEINASEGLRIGGALICTISGCIGGSGGSGVTTLGSIDSQSKTSNGATISGATLYLQSADATYAGLISTGAQVLAGNKSFTGSVMVGGSTSPQATLHVNGTIRFESFANCGSLQTDAEGDLVCGTAPSGGSSGIASTVKRKSADESITNSTTLQDDDHLNFNIGANEEYAFEFDLYITASDISRRFKAAVTAPAGATCRYALTFVGPMNGSAVGAQISTNTISTTCGTALNLGEDQNNPTNTLVKVTGSVSNGSTAGVVQLQWAPQGINVSSPVTVAAGSTLTAHKIGTNTGSTNIASNEKYPDGLAGSRISQNVTDVSTYTVPAGKTLYITNAYSESTGATLQINNNTLYWPSYPGINNYSTTLGSDPLQQPLIAGAGDVVKCGVASCTIHINGLLVDAGVTAITQSVVGTGTYTVPAGKTLYIMNITETSTTNITQLRINGNNVYAAAGAGKNTTSGTNGGLLSQPIIASAGDIISHGAVGRTVNFNGYLTNSTGTMSSPTLQNIYNNDTDGSDASILLSAADGSILFQNPASGGSTSSYVMTVDQLATGAVGGLLISNAGTGESFRVNDSAGDSTPFVIDQFGSVGIGSATPYADSKLDILANYGTATATNQYAQKIYSSFNVADTGTKAALHVDAFASNSSGTLADVRGANISAIKTSTSAVTSLIGLRLEAGNANATGTVTNAYALYIGDSNEAGAITNDYGIYQVDTTAMNYIGGSLGIGATTPAYKLDIRNGGTTGSVLHVTNSSADDGAYLMSFNSSGAYLSGGASYNGTNWVAKATSSSTISLVNGQTIFFSNTGLTAGNTFTPTARLTIAPATTEVIINVQDGTNEGGQLTLDGAGSNGDMTIDNFQGAFRVFSGSNVFVNVSSTGQTTLTSSQVNTSVTGAQLVLNNAATSTQTVMAFNVAGTTRAYQRADSGGNLVLNGTGTSSVYLGYDSGSGGVKFGNGAQGVVAEVTSGGTILSNGYVVATSNLEYKSTTGVGSSSICRSAAVNGILGGFDVGHCTSLQRYKDNTTNLTLGIETLRQLRPVEFDWNIDAHQHDLGFIAEEVEAINPILAEYSNGQLQGVKYNLLTSLITKSVQQLDVQTQAMGGQIDAMQNAVTANTDSIASVQTQLSMLQNQVANGQFSMLNISGLSTLSDLIVTGSATIGTLTVTGDTYMEGDLKVSGDTEVANLYVNGKFISKGNAPQASPGAALNGVLGASTEVIGTDGAGTIKITIGANVPTPGELADIIFDSPYTSSPKIVISGNNSKSAKLGAYIARTATGFKLVADEPLEPNTTYEFDFIVMGAETALAP